MLSNVLIDSLIDWPDMVLELDNKVRVLKIQSTKVRNYIEYVVNILLDLKGLATSIKSLT